MRKSDDELDVEFKPTPVEEEEDSESDSDIPTDEVQDIVMESLRLKNEKILRSGKYLTENYREGTIMQEFVSDEEDEDYQDSVQGEIIEEEEEDDEEEEEDNQVLKDIVSDAKDIEASDLLLNPGKVLRTGKNIALDTASEQLLAQKMQELLNEELEA